MSVHAPHASDGFAAPRGRERNPAFYLVMICLLAGIVATGFTPSFYLRGLSNSPPLDPLLLAHGALCTAWLVLLVWQSVLVKLRRVDLHRASGVAGAGLAVSMVLLGVVVAIDGARSGDTAARLGIPPLAFLPIPLGAIVIFGVLVAVAVVKRRRPETHKRLMLVATINLIPPAIARITPNIGAIAAIVGLLLLICFVRDAIAYRRVHFVFAVVGPMVFLSLPLRLAVGRTDTWFAVATWLTR